jgi:glycerate 2-kinase
MGEGVKDALPAVRVVRMPLSDGGEGLLSVLLPSRHGEVCMTTVSGPLPGQRVEARWGYVERSRTAIVEMAEAAGLGLVPEGRQNPLTTTTFGVGELITHAIDRGARTLLIGIGGSATNDGGAGMAQALGVRLRDDAGNELPRGGGALLRLASIDTEGIDPRIKHATILVACDVRNPLTGPEGASVVFGPQKGASPGDVALLDAALTRYCALLEATVHIDVQHVAGSGAAGGLGAGLLAFCGASLRRGIDLVLDETGFDVALTTADLVLTGEGRIDEQTRYGKVLSGVLVRAQRRGVPVAAVVGDINGTRSDFVGEGGLLDLAILVDEHVTAQEAMAHAALHVRRKAAQLVARLISHISKQTTGPHAS